MTKAMFANYHEEFVDSRYVRLSALSERLVPGTTAPPEQHRLAQEMLMFAVLGGRFDNKGKLLDEYASEPVPLSGTLIQYLATDEERYPTDRLLDRCWIPQSLATTWMQHALANELTDEKPRRPGPEPALRNTIVRKMKGDVLNGKFSREELKQLTGEALAAEYGGSRNTARAARTLALSELPK